MMMKVTMMMMMVVSKVVQSCTLSRPDCPLPLQGLAAAHARQGLLCTTAVVARRAAAAVGAPVERSRRTDLHTDPGGRGSLDDVAHTLW